MANLKGKANMKDIILDVVKHTAGLGFIESVKVTGTTQETRFDAMDTDRTVILNATLHNPNPDLIGEFGMGNLSFLNGVSNLSNYKEDGSEVTVNRRERNGEEQPESLLFKDADGNTDTYRFMSKQVVEQQLKTAVFKGANWNVTFEPSKQKVSELQSVASIYSAIDPTFKVKTEDGNLVLYIGGSDGASHTGRRVFANNVGGELKQGWSWPLNQVLSILKLGMSGMCVMNIADQGALQLTIDSGIGTYNYILPALTR
tara:strand:- start:1525 stop:2298 length:774 start_codon:yes stop_codon:yes gene_type:complete